MLTASHILLRNPLLTDILYSVTVLSGEGGKFNVLFPGEATCSRLLYEFHSDAG